MRQPSFSTRRKSRAYRLTRTIIGGVVLLLLVAVILSRLGGGEEQLPTPQVSFQAVARAESDGRRASKGDVDKESDAIRSLLNEWFQTAFVDPEKYGDGTFKDIEERFAKEARAQFRKDLTTLTIGEARAEVRRVVPEVSTARIAVFFEGGEEPRFATARLTFRALATLKDEEARPVRISFSGTFTLENRDGWVITYYEAAQTQRSVTPSPSPRT